MVKAGYLSENYLLCILAPLQSVKGLDLINQSMVLTHGAVSGNQPFAVSMKIDARLAAASQRGESGSQQLDTLQFLENLFL